MTEGSASRNRHRSEGEAHAIGGGAVERNAALALEVAQCAGHGHAAANAALGTQMEQMGAVLRSVGARASETLAAGAALVEANTHLATDLAAMRAAKADATASAAEYRRRLEDSGHAAGLHDPGVRAILEVNPITVTCAQNAETAASVAKAMATAALQTAARSAATMSNATMDATADMRRQIAQYRVRALDAEAAAAAMEESAHGHRAEIAGLLDAVNRFATLAGNAEATQAENRRLRGYVRNLEATMPPEQIAAAALPSNYTPPASFRRFPGAISPVLRTAAPALFAIRTMDHRELTLTEVVTEWVGMADLVAQHRDAVAAAEHTVAQLKTRCELLEATVIDERLRRTAADNALHAQAMRRLEPGSRHELDACRTKLSLALDERVALALKVDAAEASAAAADDRCRVLREELEEARSQMQASSVAPVLASMRQFYESEGTRLTGECARLRNGWSVTLAQLDDLSKRVNTAVESVAIAQRASRASATAAEQARAKQLDLAKQLSVAQARCASIERDFARTVAQNAAATTAAAVPSAGVAATKVAQSAPVSAVARNLSEACAALKRIDSSLATITDRHVMAAANDAVDAAAAEGDAAASLAAIQRIARGVEAAITDTGRARAETLERTAAKDVKISDLEGALDAAVAEIRDLQERLAAAEAIVERVAVPVAETVLGHAVHDAQDVNCPRCDRHRAAAAASEARGIEAASRIRALELREEQLVARVEEAELANRVGAAELQSKRATVERVQRRLTETRLELESITKLREDLRRAIATDNRHDGRGPSAAAENDDDADDSGTVAPAAAAADDGGDAADDDAPVAAAAAAPTGETEAATIADELASYRGVLSLLLQAARTAKAAQAVADESAAKAMAATSLDEPAAAADDDDDAAVAGSADGAARPPAATLDRRDLLSTVQRLWSVALECRGAAGEGSITAAAATPAPVAAEPATPSRPVAAAAAEAGLLPAPPSAVVEAPPPAAALPAAPAQPSATDEELQAAEARVRALEDERIAMREELKTMRAAQEKGTETQGKLQKLIGFYKDKIQALEKKIADAASA